MRKTTVLALFASLLVSCGSIPPTPITNTLLDNKTPNNMPAKQERSFYQGKGGDSDNSTLTVRVFDLPGSPVLIRDKQYTILFGASDDKNADKLIVLLKNEKIEKIDYLFIPSSDPATFSGSSKILVNFTVNYLGKLVENYEESILIRKSMEKNVMPFTQKAGAIFEANGVTFDFLYPMESDFASGLPKDQTCTILISKGNIKFLITGDIGKEAEAKMIKRGKLSKVNALICTNGAIEGSCSKEFMKIVDPEYALIGNRGKEPTIDGIFAKGQDAFTQTDWKTVQAFPINNK